MITKLLYVEFLFPVIDYFNTLNLKEFIFEWIFPFIITVLAFFAFINNSKGLDAISIVGSMINVLAILIGFSITSITLLTTGDSESIKYLRTQKSERKLNGKHIDLFQLIHIGFSFTLIIEIFTLVLLIGFIVIFNANQTDKFYEIYFAVIIFNLIQVILLNLRNITNFYFVLFRKI